MKALLQFSLIFMFISAFSLSQSYAQIPKIALVKPDGATTIHPTFQGAYDAAEDDDYIYLPGGVFNPSNWIEKKLNIIGSGAFPDSSAVTGITIITNLILKPNANGSIIEGVKITGGMLLDTVDNVILQRCEFQTGVSFGGAIGDNSNIIINNCIINGYTSCNGYCFISCNGNFTNSVFNNNVITGTFSNPGQYSVFNNNIFFYYNIYGGINLPSDSEYNNNIFTQAPNTPSVSNSVFYNNVNITAPIGANNQNYNQISESFPEIFENPGNNPPWYGYEPSNDYHVKTTSQCKNSGTDGTDRGMYGGTYPWVEGMVPSNPHIYFKSVSPQTNPNGQLQVHFRVRTGN